MHTHHWICGSPDSTGHVPGTCECGTTRTFYVEPNSWLNSGRPATSIQGALRHRADVSAEIREIEHGLLMKGW